MKPNLCSSRISVLHLSLAVIASFAVGIFAGRQNGDSTAGVKAPSVDHLAPSVDRLAPIVDRLRSQQISESSTTQAARGPVMSMQENQVTVESLHLLTGLAATSNEGIFELTASIASLDAVAVRKLLAGLELGDHGGSSGASVRALLEQQLVRLDPSAVLAEWLTLPSEERATDSRMDNLFFQLGRRDPATARVALDQVEAGFSRNQAALAFLNGQACTDPGAAMQSALGLGFSDEDGFYSFTAAAWARQNPAGAAEGVSHLPVVLRDAALRSVMESWSVSDRIAAAEWVKQQSPEIQAAAWPATLSNLLAMDGPESAVHWAENLPMGPARTAALTRAGQQWTAFDPASASAWVAKLPAGDEREAMAASLIENISSDDPESALVWAQTLASPGERQRTVGEIAGRWWASDPSAARAVMGQ